MSINRATVLGNVGGDPEIHKTQDGRPIATFSVATNESWQDKNTGEKKERVEWHRIVVFAEGLVTKVVEPHVRKGMMIFIEGKLQTRKYTDKNNVERWTTEIVLQGFDHKIQLCGSPGGNRPPPPTDQDIAAADRSGASATRTAPARRGDMHDEIPF